MSAGANHMQPAGSEKALPQKFLRQFLRLAGPFFTSEEWWLAWLLLVSVLGLTLLQIGIAVRLNLWNRDFFDALDRRDWNGFITQMGIFALLAGATMGVSVYQVYLRQLLQLRWRRWLTSKLVGDWLAEDRHYRLGFIAPRIDNPDQRISENARNATEMAVEFALGIFDKVISLASFIGILWAVSGALDFAVGTVSVHIPGYMVFAALLYAGFGSILTLVVGRPLVAANLRQNTTEADYRFALLGLREDSEAVALMRGGEGEKRVLTHYFEEVLRSTIGLMRTQRRLMWLTSFYAIVGWVYPALVASPRFFAGAISLGELMQITAAFGQVQTSLNYFVDNFPRIAEWRSHVGRLLEFESALGSSGVTGSQAREPPTIVLTDGSLNGGPEELRFEKLQITHPDGAVIIENADLQITRGEHVLILGPSGSGKSTVFRAVAGLWPWGAGRILLPDRRQMMFMPQRPHLPLDTLRAAIAYPAPMRRFPAAAIEMAMRRCGLDHLIHRLADRADWDQVLSLGEQQRLAFARLLLHKPAWVFLDEAVSALDDDDQDLLMGLFNNELAGTTVVAIAHAGSAEGFFDRVLSLQTAIVGARLVADPQASTAPNPAAGGSSWRRGGQKSAAREAPLVR